MFLVDSSLNVGKDNFKKVIEFVYNLVDLFYTERDKLRIGMAHYATDVTNDFYLNTYSNRDDVISAIGRVEYKGGRRAIQVQPSVMCRITTSQWQEAAEKMNKSLKFCWFLPVDAPPMTVKQQHLG